MIVKVNALSACIILLQIALRGQKEKGQTQIRVLSSNFERSAGEKSPSSPSSYAPVVVRKYRISLLTKFTMVKLKIDFLSVSTTILKSALR